jgi:hypothetical protein
MSTLAETINNALAAIGPSTEGRLRDIIAEFGGLNLSEEERISVLATVIAAAAATHHVRHKNVYLEAVRTWALEISAELQPPPVRLSNHASTGPVEEGAEILIGGLDSLIEAMTSAGVGIQDRLVTELALVARLLGEHDVNTVHFTLMAVAQVLADDAYRAGDQVLVPLREAIRPLSREESLETLQPRGVA